MEKEKYTNEFPPQKSSNNKNVCSHSLSLYCYVCLFFPWVCRIVAALFLFGACLIQRASHREALCQVALTIDHDFFQQLQSKSYESSEGLQDSWREELTSGEVRLLLGNFWGASGLYPLSIAREVPGKPARNFRRGSGRFWDVQGVSGRIWELSPLSPTTCQKCLDLYGECLENVLSLLHDPGRMDFLELFSPKRGITCRSGI